MSTEQQRKQMVLAMEYICRHVNNEAIFDLWLSNGVADGDIAYGETDIQYVPEDYVDNTMFSQIMHTFLSCMKLACDDGGLYCGGQVSL